MDGDGVGRTIMDEQKEIMTYAEAAKYLGLPLGTMYSMVARKEIPHVRLGPRLVRFPRTALSEWIRRRTVVPHASSDSEPNTWRESDADPPLAGPPDQAPDNP